MSISILELAPLEASEKCSVHSNVSGLRRNEKCMKTCLVAYINTCACILLFSSPQAYFMRTEIRTGEANLRPMLILWSVER